MKKKLWSVLCGAAVGCSALLAADFDRFLKASDGEVIGILMLGKEKLSITGTIKQVTWTGTNGVAIVLKWDGKALTQETPR